MKYFTSDNNVNLHVLGALKKIIVADVAGDQEGIVYEKPVIKVEESRPNVLFGETFNHLKLSTLTAFVDEAAYDKGDTAYALTIIMAERDFLRKSMEKDYQENKTAKKEVFCSKTSHINFSVNDVLFPLKLNQGILNSQEIEIDTDYFMFERSGAFSEVKESLLVGYDIAYAESLIDNNTKETVYLSFNVFFDKQNYDSVIAFATDYIQALTGVTATLSEE